MKRERAIEILEALLDGADPLTGEVLPRDHVCQEADVMRALHAAVLALQDWDADAPEIRAHPELYTKRGRLNAGRPWTEEDCRQLISLHLENTPMEDMCRLLQRRPRGVRNQLIYLGLTPPEDAPPMREGRKHPVQTDQRGKPWTRDDHEWLMAAWAEGCTVAEMAAHLGRTPHAIRLRLEKEGKYEGGLTAADEPPAWTEADNKELFRMVDEGCSIARMAQRFGRTEKAMEARLFYLGLSNKSPKLF